MVVILGAMVAYHVLWSPSSMPRAIQVDMGVWRQLRHVQFSLRLWEGDHGCSLDDPIPTWDMVLPKGEPKNPADYRMGSFVANGYRDNYGNPIHIVKVPNPDQWTFHYEARLDPKSLERLKKSRYGRLAVDLKSSTEVEVIDAPRLLSLQRAKSLHDAFGKGDVAKMEELLRDDPKLIHAMDAEGKTLLYRAVTGYRKERVKLLLDHGAEVCADDGRALRHAASVGWSEVTDLLLAKVASEDAPNKTQILRLALQVATLRGHDAITGSLRRSGATLGVQILDAAAIGDLEAVQALLAETPKLSLSKDPEGLTALHCAALSGHEAVAEALLASGAEVNAGTKAGRTPLHLAALGNHTDMAALLVSRGAHVNAADAVERRTPLHWAALRGYRDIADLLVNHGANIHLRAFEGWTPLLCAAQNGHKEIVELLLARGADVNVRDNGGNTPLQFATRRTDRPGFPEIAELLRKQGATE